MAKGEGAAAQTDFQRRDRRSSSFAPAEQPVAATNAETPQRVFALIVVDVEYVYDGWGNLYREYQEHDGEVDAATLYTEYDYDDGAVDGVAKYVRLVDVVYPNGRAVGYDYGDASSQDIDQVTDYVMSRLSSIFDDTDADGDIVSTYTYDTHGNVTAVVGGIGRSDRGYDAARHKSFPPDTVLVASFVYAMQPHHESKSIGRREVLPAV